MDITLVYFVYGLAFFSMGLVMLFESGRSPVLVEAQVLIPLSIFGLVHGSHEWLEMFLNKSGWISVINPGLWDWIRLVVLTISFTSLLVFGLRLLRPQWFRSRRRGYRFGLAVTGYVLIVFLVGSLAWNLHGDFIAHLDSSARYLLAVPGAMIAGIVLHRQASQARNPGPKGLGAALQTAAWGFTLYAFTQLVVPPLDIFPASIVNTATFTEFTGIPVQVIRAIMAVMIMIGLLQASRVAEKERQRQLSAVQQSRLDALERLEREMHEREAMRQNLLRHIVLVQEDERSRIARELHDETAQILTAFSFHLAALRELLNGNGKAKQQLEYLQSLCRRMSVGLYKLVHDLRPSQLDDLGLVAAFQYLSDEASEQIGLAVKLEVLGERRRLDPLVETVMYRVAQEALTNVVRHSGVKEANLRLEFQPEQVSVQVIDIGCGFDSVNFRTQKQGWGIEGMRERVDSIGGELIIQSTPGKGTVVEVIVRESAKAQLQAI